MFIVENSKRTTERLTKASEPSGKTFGNLMPVYRLKRSLDSLTEILETQLSETINLEHKHKLRSIIDHYWV